MAGLELINEDQATLELTDIHLALSPKCRDEKACIPMTNSQLSIKVRDVTETS